MTKHGKKYTEAIGLVDRARTYQPEEAIGLTRKAAPAKFDETVEIHIRLGVDPKQSDQSVRGTVTLPNGIGKTRKVVVIARGEKQKEAQASGADEFGAEDLIEKIQANLHILKAAHAQLDFMNSKALSTLRQIRDRLRETKKLIKEVYNLFEEVEPAEKDIKKESNRFSRGVTAAQNQISEMERESPEEILINLAGNGGVILESQIVLSKKILDVDEKYLLTLIGLVIDAMQRAYYAEEALRIGNEYFARLLKAHMGFEELVEKAINIGVLQGSDANSLTQEIQIEKMEAEISKVEEKAAQNEKSLFIKAIHTTEEARKTLHGHIDYINNLIKYTEQTKNYFLDSLAKLMEGMHAIKGDCN